MEVDKKSVYSILFQSLSCLYKNDRKLFDYKGRNYERALAFRLAHYLANIVENDKHSGLELNVDNEYERHIEDPKSCFMGCDGCQNDECFVRVHKNEILQRRRTTDSDSLDNNVRPDIIVHERRTNENNCFVIEVKSTGNDLKDNPDVYDAAKLTYLTCSNPESTNKYHYSLGIAISLTKSKSKIWTFVDGNIYRSFIVPFDNV